LVIEAQREGLAQFAEAEGFEIVTECIEVETGKGSDALDRRPQLSAAGFNDYLELCLFAQCDKP
jgi:hypothetical protein